MTTPTMRFRERSPTEVTGTVNNVYVPDGTVYHTQNQIVTSTGGFSIEDVVTPNFRKLSKEGVLVISPCSMAATTVTSGGGTIQFRRKSDNQLWWEYQGDGSRTQMAAYTAGVSLDPIFSRTLSLDDLEDKCKQQSLSNVDSAPYGFAEDIAELRETVEFVKNPLKSARNLALKMHKAVKRRAKKFKQSDAEALASVWLEYRFALSPLIRSIDDAISAASASYSKVIQPYYTGRSKILESDEGSTQLTGSNAFVFTRVNSHTVECSSGVYYKTTNPIDTLLEGLGLRFKDVPTTMWAVFPLSFMVDRMYNITNFLNGMRVISDPQLQIIGGWSSIKETIAVTTTVTGFTDTSWNSVVVGDPVQKEYFSYGRSRWDPSFLDTLPTFDIEGLYRDILAITDLTALTINLLLSKPNLR